MQATQFVMCLLTLGTGLLLLLLPGPPLSCAQTVSEYQVKAAYVYNFSKFVEWPAQAFASPAAPIRLCVLKDPAFESELNQIVKGKMVGGRAMTVVPVQTGEQSLQLPDIVYRLVARPAVSTNHRCSAEHQCSDRGRIGGFRRKRRNHKFCLAG